MTLFDEERVNEALRDAKRVYNVSLRLLHEAKLRAE